MIALAVLLMTIYQIRHSNPEMARFIDVTIGKSKEIRDAPQRCSRGPSWLFLFCLPISHLDLRSYSSPNINNIPTGGPSGSRYSSPAQAPNRKLFRAHQNQ